MALIEHPTVADRVARGKAARGKAAPGDHAGWTPAPDRRDPVALLDEQNATREPDLVPVRHGRMMVSPFTFYRGAARVMAEDLAATPTAGLHVQLCGDAHLSNFGVYASPERSLVFDLNDFDETLPGPFEYDVARMAASFTIAARNNGHSPTSVRAATLASVHAYRTAMAEFASKPILEVWYDRISEADIQQAIQVATGTLTTARDRKDAKAIEKSATKTTLKAHSRTSLQALSKLATLVDGRYRIVSQPPVVVPLEEAAARIGIQPDVLERVLHDQFRAYRETLQDDRRHLLEQFQVVDVARKVVGVGSVGTRAFIALLQGRDQQDPLFLQVKEATRSVLEAHLPPSRYSQPGERVVQGQRLMQAASDIFLGWTKGVQDGRYYYWRQLRDMKGSAAIETMTPLALELYAGLCGGTLARAHARSGDAVAISAYLGKKDRFDRSITDFSERYADQNERDYEAFVAAIRSGRLAAVEGI
jgi:uncharacterized protein (DUF2252 family)